MDSVILFLSKDALHYQSIKKAIIAPSPEWSGAPEAPARIAAPELVNLYEFAWRNLIQT